MEKSDKFQMNKHGIDPEYVEHCLNLFSKGKHYTKIYAPALKEDNNIITLNEGDVCDNYKDIKITSFIPASGAATRMFKLLYETLDQLHNNKFCFDKDNNDPQSIEYFFNNIEKFAFYEPLFDYMMTDSYPPINSQEIPQYEVILKYILTDIGLNYGDRPKALILFHKSKDRPVFAFEEHLVEAAKLTSSNEVYLHFTLSPNYINIFNEELEKIIDYYSNNYNCHFHVDYSIQKKSTDTIAVNTDNTPFRNHDGSLLFRPAGHGALIYNMNELDTDIIMIRNIDNVLPEDKQQTVIKYRKMMINHLLKLNKKRNDILSKIENSNDITGEYLKEVEDIAINDFNIFLPNNYTVLSFDEKLKNIRELLDRPMRICGMVENIGEPGGGPFVVIDQYGNKSLQIVEGAQINHDDPEQEAIFKSSTHFNPVDIICMTKDKNGNKYDLTKYIDPDTYFISDKFKDGKPLKALELPGLWNGAMSKWITIFAEVPIETFNPVKTVNDLLRPAHL